MNDPMRVDEDGHLDRGRDEGPVGIPAPEKELLRTYTEAGLDALDISSDEDGFGDTGGPRVSPTSSEAPLSPEAAIEEADVLQKYASPLRRGSVVAEGAVAAAQSELERRRLDAPESSGSGQESSRSRAQSGDSRRSSHELRLPPIKGASARASSAESRAGVEGSPERRKRRRLLNVIVEFDPTNQFAVTIPFASGTQTIKWASIVALRQAQTVGGRNTGPMVAANGFRTSRGMLPAAVFVEPGPGSPPLNDRSRPLSPTTRIADLVTKHRDLTLRVRVQRRPTAALGTELERDGSLKRSTWAWRAFSHSDIAKQRLEVREEEEERVAAARDKEERRRKLEAEARSFAALDRIMSGQDNPEALAQAIKSNWEHIRLSLVTDDAEEQEKLKRAILENYEAISDIFKHFSGSGATSRTDVMSETEWRRCLIAMPSPATSAPIFDAGLDREHAAMLDIFKRANAKRGDGDAVSFMNRWEFCEALLLLAIWKFPTGRGSNRPCPPSEAFDRLLKSHLLPAAGKLSVGVVRKAMKSRSVKAVLSKSLMPLREVFLRYCRLDASEDDSSHTMNLKEYLSLLDGAGLFTRRSPNPRRGAAGKSGRVEKEAPPHHFTRAMARVIFDGVQNEPPSEEQMNKVADEDTDEEEGLEGLGKDADDATQMVLSEFIEALARVSLAKWSDTPGWGASDCIMAGIKAVSAMRKRGFDDVAAGGAGGGALQGIDSLPEGVKAYTEVITTGGANGTQKKRRKSLVVAGMLDE